MRKSQGERSGLYGGCWSVSQTNIWSLSLTRLVVWGRALSWVRSTVFQGDLTITVRNTRIKPIANGGFIWMKIVLRTSLVVIIINFISEGSLILILVTKFNLPLIGTFTWPTPPGPYRATTCRGRELNYGSHTYLFDHTRTWRASPDEWSAQCRGHLRDSTNMKDNRLHTKHTLRHPNKAKMEWWLRRPNDTRGPWGPKVSWQVRKNPEKTSPRKLVPTGDRTRAPLRDNRACYHLLHSDGRAMI